MKPVRTLIVVADDGVARFLVNRGVGMGLDEIAMVRADDRNPPDPDDRRPRNRHGGPHAVHHGIEPRTPAEAIEREAFARTVMMALQDLWRSAIADRLVVVAPPRMLGTLRDHLPDGLSPALHAELAKDLTGLSLQALPAHLDGLLAL